MFTSLARHFHLSNERTDRQRQQAREWAANNPDKIKAWRDANLDKVHASQKKYRDAHPETANRTAKIKRERQIEYLNELKKQGCIDCGNTDPRVLQFDHVPERGPKLFKVTSLPATWNKFLAEIAKCDIVCANCHAIRTHARGQLQQSSLQVQQDLCALADSA